MKRKLLLSVIAGAMTLTIGVSAIAIPAKPCDTPEPRIEGQPGAPVVIQKPPMEKPPMPPVDKMKAEFDKRINLTDAQRAEIEKIKAEEKKQIEPLHQKIEKKREELKVLTKKEIDIRTESLKKFEAILTAEQKAELEKMKKEFEQKMMKEFEKNGPHKRQPMTPIKPGCTLQGPPPSPVCSEPKVKPEPKAPCQGLPKSGCPLKK